MANLLLIVDWDGWHLKVVTEPTSFSSSLPVRRVGVNAFGYGGTNGHAILENVDFVASTYRRHKAVNPLVEDSKSDPDEDEDRAHLLVFSAHDKATLKRNINAYSGIGHKPSLLDLAYTLSTRRSKHSCRAYAVCRKESYSVDLEKASDSVVEKSGPATVAFAFTGKHISQVVELLLMHCNRARCAMAEDGHKVVPTLSIFSSDNKRA